MDWGFQLSPKVWKTDARWALQRCYRPCSEATSMRRTTDLNKTSHLVRNVPLRRKNKWEQSLTQCSHRHRFSSEISSISLGFKKDGFCMKTLMEHIFKVVQARQTPAFAFPFKYHNILNPWNSPVSAMCVCSVQHNCRWLPIDKEIKTQRLQYVIWRVAHRADSCSRVSRWHTSRGWSCNTSWQLSK